MVWTFLGSSIGRNPGHCPATLSATNRALFGNNAVSSFAKKPRECTKYHAPLSWHLCHTAPTMELRDTVLRRVAANLRLSLSLLLGNTLYNHLWSEASLPAHLGGLGPSPSIPRAGQGCSTLQFLLTLWLPQRCRITSTSVLPWAGTLQSLRPTSTAPLHTTNNGKARSFGHTLWVPGGCQKRIFCRIASNFSRKCVPCSVSTPSPRAPTK